MFFVILNLYPTLIFLLHRIMRKPLAIVEPYFKSRNKVISSFLALLLIGLFTNGVYAQLTTNTFSGTTVCPTHTGNVFSPVTNAAVTPFSRSTMTCNAGNNVFNSTMLNATSSRNDASYIEFSITANSGYALNLTSLSFLRSGSGTAPNSLIVSYSTDPIAANFNSTRVDLGTSTTPSSVTSLTLTPPTAITTASGGKVIFRFYTFGTTSVSGGTAASGGTFRVDDVTLYGSVVSASVSDTPPTVASTTPANSALSVLPSANIGLTFSEAVSATASSFSIVGSVSGTHTFMLSGGPTTYLLNPDVDFTDGEMVTVTALAAQITDQDGPADNMAMNYSFAFSILSTVSVVRIHDIQGSGTSFNPVYSGTQSIEGIVTRTFSGTAMLSGFYVQEEDADADTNPLTSEGIFVYDPTGLFTGNEGDKVKITGTVAEYTSGASSSLTQLANLISVVDLGASTLPTPTPVSLPVASVSALEAYESMLVTMSAAAGNLAVTEYFQLGRFGQVVLAATGASNQTGTDARLDQYTQFNAPSTTGYAAYLAEIAKRKIILDDGSGVQNPAQILFGRGGMPLSASNTLRGGDEVSSITTVLDERFEGYRLQSNTGVNFIPTNTRPTTPPSVGGTLKIASANVLNFFVNLDMNAPGTDYRGANTAQEFTRQRDKIIKNLVGSGADVFGIMELQNNGTTPTTAVQDLVAGLNAEPGSSGTYAFIDPAGTGGSISTDAITVGIIYKTDKVTTVGAPATLTSSAAFNLVGRRPLAQTFRQNSNNEIFTLVVNHFKSKGSKLPGAGADDNDMSDGQGLSNGTRKRQAQDLADWLATKPTGTTDADYLVVGDLNAYAKEDPLTTLATAGYSNLLPATSYSYVFDGQVGSLDHALASSNLTTQVTGAEKWHINADEPTVLDYNTENKTTGQVTSLYNADQFRSSDHDPVLIGLNLVTPPDLTPILYARPSSINGTTNITVVVDVVELNSVATNGVVTVKIPKDPAFTLSLNQTAASVNGHTVQNSGWNFSGPSGGFYTLTSSQAMAAGSVLSFGLDGVLTPGGTMGTLTFSAIVVGSSGEVKIDNNIDADKIDYFQQ